jgi:hypothetical protein
VDLAPCTVTLWHASGVDVPRELLSALSGVKSGAGGVKVQVVGDPFLALAHMCRATRDERRVPETPTAARLVIVFPEMLTDAAELCLAADAYAPGVPRWQYGPAANPTLRPIVEADVTAWCSRGSDAVVVPQPREAVVPRASSRTMAPQLRLAGEGPGVTLDNRAESADAGLAGEGVGQALPPTARSVPLISDEELRMLLGESNDESR